MNATEPRKLAAGLCTGEALFRKARPRRLLRSALTVNAKGRYYIYLDVCACLLCSHNVRRDLGCHITGYIVKINQLPAPLRDLPTPAPHKKHRQMHCPAFGFFWRGMSGRFLQKQAESPQPFCFSENAFYFYLVPEEFLGYNKRGNHIRR